MSVSPMRPILWTTRRDYKSGAAWFPNVTCASSIRVQLHEFSHRDKNERLARCLRLTVPPATQPDRALLIVIVRVELFFW